MVSAVDRMCAPVDLVLLVEQVVRSVDLVQPLADSQDHPHVVEAAAHRAVAVEVRRARVGAQRGPL